MNALSFEIQDLPDIIRIITLIRFRKQHAVNKATIKLWIANVCTSHVCVDDTDIERTLKEMSAESLVIIQGDQVSLTVQGTSLSKEWQKFFGRSEPVLELIAGLADGSITALVVIISAFIGSLTHPTTTFAAFLTLAAVAITNFSSFFLGGITEDISDLLNLHNLIHYSVSDIPDKQERDKSLLLIKELFALLHGDIRRASIISATVCGITTFLAGSLPIATYLYLPAPVGLIASLGIVGAILGIFLVRYRAWRSKVNWRVTLVETIAIISIAVVASLLLGSI